MANPTMMMWKKRLAKCGKSVQVIGHKYNVLVYVKIILRILKNICKNFISIESLFIIALAVFMAFMVSMVISTERTPSAAERLREADEAYKRHVAEFEQKRKGRDADKARMEARATTPMPPKELKGAILSGDKVCLREGLKGYTSSGKTITYDVFEAVTVVCKDNAEQKRLKEAEAKLRAEQRAILNALK